MELSLGLVTWIPQRLWETFTGRRQCTLTVHEARFTATGRACYFLNITNLSRNREVEVTHVWFATDPEVHVSPPDRPLPKRLKPDEPWETWVERERLPTFLGASVFTLGRARLSTGHVIKSRKGKGIPSQGAIPGGPVATPPA
jgi:hypothetical protein